MDYYTPLEHRKQSYREFMEEWIVAEFLRLLEDYGLQRPWYWDEFMAGLDTWQHALHLGVWWWRPTVWWHPQAGVSKAERAWLQEKYPRWEEQFGGIWDQIIRTVNQGAPERTLPVDMPWLCNLCQLPIGTATGPRDLRYPVRSYALTHNGRTHHFCSRPCRRIWWEDKDMLHHRTVVDRLLAGEIQPPTLPGILEYMGLTQEAMGRDAYDYRWAEEYRHTAAGGGGRDGTRDARQA
jgi:toluene monooxygenase system protein A